MKILKPNHLNSGDIIGIISSSFGLMPEFLESYEKGKKEILEMGFRVKEGKNIKLIKWWGAGDPQDQAEDINNMFLDPEVKAIISQNGGHSALSVLPYIDFEVIKNNPKPFIGFSDINIYHLAMLKKSGLVGFHMDTVTYGLGWQWGKTEQKNEYSKLFKKILIENVPLGEITSKSQWECWKNGVAEGRLIGGNLNIISVFLGTKYFPNDYFENSIFFWEADNASLARIAKELYQLKYSGLLDQIKGMIIGKISLVPRVGYGISEPKPKELILDIFKDYKFPILANADFGHETANIPMPIGVGARINSGNLLFEILESATI